MEYIVIFFLQLLMSIFKVLEIKWSYENKTTYLTILAGVMSTVWLLSTTIGVSSILQGDYVMAIFFVLSSSLGKIIALTFFSQNRYRNKIFKKLLKEVPNDTVKKRKNNKNKC